MLRAVVWTLGIAVVATPILVTAFTEFLPTTRVRSNEVPYGNPVVLKVVERHVDRSAGRMFGLFTPREELEHVVEATSADRSARLTWDVPGDRWTLRTRNSEDSGVGRPSLESIEQMAAAVAGRPATRPASIESIPVNAAGAVVQPPPAEAIRVILHWHLRALPPALVRKRSLAIVVRQNGPVAEGVPNEWMTEPQTMPFARSLAYQAPLVTGNQTSRSKPMLALTYASWPLVWLLGLPLVLRRRAVRVQSHDRLAGQEGRLRDLLGIGRQSGAEGQARRRPAVG
ncbi:MAG: hypothetical protein AAGI46_16355, partial [Planctomycetota bacterium]